MVSFDADTLHTLLECTSRKLLPNISLIGGGLDEENDVKPAGWLVLNLMSELRPDGYKRS